MIRSALLVATLAAVSCATGPSPRSLRALIVDGQSNHVDWALQTRMVRSTLEQTGLFVVDVATAPPKGSGLSGFRPEFSRYDVVVSVYNGDLWPEPTRRALEEFVRGGKGFVSVHAADNSFPGWPEYNRMIGLGGWYARNEKSGPYVYYEGEKLVRNPTAGLGGSHGVEHRFAVDAREPDHPILRGLPQRWLHERDELYDRLRGPAENMTVLATAFSDPATGGSGRHEPVLMTVRYGEGRVFHTTLGHGAYSRECVGFIATLQRGAEWAATGEVTQLPPDDFPHEDGVRYRRFPETRSGLLCLAFSPDGATIATGGEDGTVRLVDPRTGESRKSLGRHDSVVTSVAFSPDGRRVVSSARDLRLWEVASGESDNSWPESAAFAPDGRRIAVGGKGVAIWDTTSLSMSPVAWAVASRVVFSPDGAGVAAACADGTVKVWKLTGGEPLVLKGHVEPVDVVAYGTRIVSGGRDGRVRVWDATSGQQLQVIEPKAGWINDVRYSPNGKFIAVAHSHLTLWDPETGKLLATLTQARERIQAVAFSPDGTSLASIGSSPGFRLWEIPAELR